jgi:3-oxoacyl-[acyl-carrier protein] reductase
MTVEDFRAVLDTNLTATFLVTRAFLPAMLKRRRGRVIQVASISSTLGSPRASAYCAAKWGVVGFTKSLAEELRGTGLSAMSILPGSVETSMLEGSGFSPQMKPEDVAKTIVYAALDAPSAMNGSSFEMFGP